MLNVAILGATSHVAKNLIYQNNAKQKWRLYLYVRDIDKMEKFLKLIKDDKKKNVFLIDNFQSNQVDFDSVINCVGFGTPSAIKQSGIELFQITESIDNLILNYLKQNPKTGYINFSSGAVYGTTLDKPVEEGQKSVTDVQPLKEQDFYRIAKLYSEAKHRCLKNLNIVDIRLFSFFSRFIDVEGKFLLTEIVESLKQSKPFRTTNMEIFRDYISPLDLYNLVNACVVSKKINAAVDAYSKEPISKSILLRELSIHFSLKVEIIENVESSPTGSKAYYYSNNKLATDLLEYKPLKTSIESIIEEIEILEEESIKDNK